MKRFRLETIKTVMPFGIRKPFTPLLRYSVTNDVSVKSGNFVPPIGPNSQTPNCFRAPSDGLERVHVDFEIQFTATLTRGFEPIDFVGRFQRKLIFKTELRRGGSEKRGVRNNSR